MKAIWVVLGSLVLFGCASLPDNYSELTIEQLIKGISSNNKPKIMPSNYSVEVYEEIEMFTANYNVVGSYTSGLVLNAIEEAKKYCLEKGFETSEVLNKRERYFLFCSSGNSSFIAFHYVSTQRAGWDTGQTFAYFDHIAFFNISKHFGETDIDIVASKISEFEESSVDQEYVLDYRPIQVDEVVSLFNEQIK
ncbi:hypothetical protein [Alteromonas gracilis]|uniref:hypothetical protein n=1 Tax=Alteromonas gracilis TaxID=1479524 RepID=UPI0037351584